MLAAPLLLLLGAAAGRAADLPPWLPRYDVHMDLDLAGHQARVRMRATWTNRHRRPAKELVFNAHSRYVVPDKDIGLMAKTLEILRMQPGETLGEKKPAFDLHTVTLAAPPGAPAVELPFRFEGDTGTALVVSLPCPVGPGESVTVDLDFTFHLPQKQGRWGQWCDVTFLSNWLPVFAYYDDCRPPTPEGTSKDWQPTPFVPWHQPFFNEAAVYRVWASLPCGQQVATTGTVVAARPLDGGRQELEIHAAGVRDFAFLCSARYQAFEGEVPAGPGVPAPIRVHILAFPEHEYYAREMLRIACEALTAYSRWFGPYPYADFTIAEAFFGWNGNECATLVMIDERVFNMPHLAGGYVDYLVSHETCHQWWYNAVGTNGYCETWMDEALATHFSHRLLNEKVGKNNSLVRYPRGLEWLPNVRREDYRSYGLLGTLGRGENGPCVRDIPQFDHLVNLFSMCYDKGARIVGMIEERMGPTAFLDFMRTVYCKYRFRILRVADFRQELEAYTGHSWEKFFADWLYGPGLCDWAVDKVVVQDPPCAARRCCLFRHRRLPCGTNLVENTAGLTRVVVFLSQRGDCTEQTAVGFALPGCEGYPVRIPVIPGAQSYRLDDPPACVEALDPTHFRVEVLLPAEPTQVAVDPDQILVDKDPSNNFWKPPLRWRVTPLYTFLEETDLTNAYDRWNVIAGPWIYGTVYDEAWYTRSTMVGVRAGAYRTQAFDGGVYAAYRTDFRDVVVGADGLWDHWPASHFQAGFNVEQRLTTFQNGDDHAFRGVMFGRYIFQYGSSLYLPPMQYLEAFTAYQDNFLPFVSQPEPEGERFQRTTTAGLHYRINYLTPYWDPEGGFLFDVTYQGGFADLDTRQGLNMMTGQLAAVKYLPDLTGGADAVPGLEPARPLLEYLADTRLAVRLYGAAGLPTRGEFFSLGGGTLFRGFDLAQRQGSMVWVGSVELRLPLARRLNLDVCDHLLGLRNVYGAVFYDIGDAYTNNHSVGPVAHGVGAGLRLDLAWFSFVERTILRLDVAKAVNTDTGVQVWFGVQHPF
jgi:hypothetical protein